MAAIMVLTAGSTGDFEPFAALAERLGSRGHIVTLTADAGFERLAPGGPVDFAPIRADFQSMVPTPERKRPSLRGEVFPVIRGMLEDSWTVARSTQPQVIIAHQKSLAAPHLAEKLDIPHVQALTVPMLTPTREFPLPGIIRHNLGAILNRASYRLIGMLTRPYQGLIRDWRSASLALAPRGNPPPPRKTLYCYSPSLVSTPADWPPDTIATGYWLREDRSDAEPLHPDLESFLAAGEPPIYIGFGSSVGPDPAHLAAVVSSAVQQAGIRAVIARVGSTARHAAQLQHDGDQDRATSLALPSRCRRRPSRRRGDDRCRPTRSTSNDHLPLPGRPALLGSCGSPRRRRVPTNARQEARPRATCVDDPESPR